MSSALERLERLRHHSNLAADDALIELIACGEPELAHEAMSLLLERRSEIGLQGIVRVYDRIAADLQGLAVENVAILSPALRQAIADRDPQACKNAVDIIAGGMDYRLTYLLHPCLTHGAPGVRDAAAAAMILLLEKYMERCVSVRETCQTAAQSSGPDWNACHVAIESVENDRRELITTLERAFDNYHVHVRSDLLHAGLPLAADLTSGFWVRASEPTTKLGRAVSERLQSSQDPRLVRTIYRALIHPSLRAAVIRMLERCRNRELLDALAEESWLLRLPKIQRAFASIRKLRWFENGPAPMLDAHPRIAARMVTVLMATGIAQNRKIMVLQECLNSDRPDLQRAALWALVSIEDPAVSDVLRTVLNWDDPECTPIAMTELMRRHPEKLDSLMIGQLKSQSPRIRSLAKERVATVSFDRCWSSFDRLDESQRRDAARAMAKLEPDLPRILRAKLTSACPTEQVRAIQVIRLLSMAEEMHELLFRLCHAADSVVRSAAVSALAELESPTAERIARLALNDPDTRVQANAIEALVAFDIPKHRASLEKFLNAEDNRVRANAIQALLTQSARQAAVALFEMLKHDSHLHRISALWVIDRLGLASVIDLVGRLARTDTSPMVRKQAGQVYEKLARQRALTESAP